MIQQMTRATSARPTLLVFTLGEDRESRRRRLLPAAHLALERRLHRACLEAALDAGRRIGLDLEVSSPIEIELPADARHERQRGHGFGARVRHALDGAFARGDGPVVLVGSDTPGLDARHLRRALSALEGDPDRVVLGPAPDGGFYLLAAARPLDEALAAVRWRCRDTLASLKRALGRLGRHVVLLPALRDLDSRSDLERWLAGAGRALGAVRETWRQLVAWLLAILADLRSAAPGRAESIGRWAPAQAQPPRGPPPF